MIKTHFTIEDIKAMMEASPCLRDKLIISFLSDSGCRVSELLKVKLEHVDLEDDVVLIPHLKRGIKKTCPSCHRSAGRSQPFCARCGADLSQVIAEGIEERSRLINIGSATKELIKEYIAKRSSKTDFLINISRGHIWYIIREIAKSAGLKGKIFLNPETGKKHYPHPHSFRDSLAIDWLSIAGDDVSKQKALQEHLGHRRFETTMRYHKLTPAAVRKVSDEVRKKRFE